MLRCAQKVNTLHQRLGAVDTHLQLSQGVNWRLRLAPGPGSPSLSPSPSPFSTMMRSSEAFVGDQSILNIVCLLPARKHRLGEVDVKVERVDNQVSSLGGYCLLLCSGLASRSLRTMHHAPCTRRMKDYDTRWQRGGLEGGEPCFGSSAIGSGRWTTARLGLGYLI